jgi:Leucine-rich repeat (LRR) protein
MLNALTCRSWAICIHRELTKNRILEVQVGHLQNLTQLTTLLLTDNEITTLHDFVFVDTCKLSKLFLNRNPLERIEQYALVGTELKIM